MSHPASPALEFKKNGSGGFGVPTPVSGFQAVRRWPPNSTVTLDRHPRPSPKAESPFDYFLALGFCQSAIASLAQMSAMV
jgi:hypothetical protein